MSFLKALGAFWIDFIIGDDKKIAGYTLAVLAVVTVLATTDVTGDGVIALLGTALICACFAVGVTYDARKK